MESPAKRTTQLLRRVNEGDASASEELVRHVHDELRDLAQAHMASQSSGHTLQPTALVNEAYLKLVESEDASWQTRNHFFAMVSQIMRSILVDHARRKKAKKRGGDRVQVALDSGWEIESPSGALDLIDLDEALERLAQVNQELVGYVELRFFAGRSVKEIAEILETPIPTVERRLRAATAWLREAMGHGRETD